MHNVRSPAVQSFLDRLPAELANRFTPDQLAAIDLHFGNRYRVDHSVDIRRRFLSRFYLIILAGREHRRAD